MCHRLARKEGMLVGGSAGMNVHASVELANSLEEPATIVTVLCDTGIKYLTKVSTRCHAAVRCMLVRYSVAVLLQDSVIVLM